MALTVEEFQKIGYINYGYISPEISSPDEYPSYIKKAAWEAVEKIQSQQNRNSITFGFMTDLHYSETYNHNIRGKRLMNAYKDTAAMVGCDTLILGGDYVNDGTKAYKSNGYRGLRAQLSGIDYLPVNGNHDDNSIWDNNCIFHADGINKHTLSREELYMLFYNHLPQLGAEFDNENPGLYYLYNDNVKKVRYIFIDTADIPELLTEDGKPKYTKQHTMAVSQKQINWLLNKALKFDEKGWDIIFVTHEALKPSFENVENTEARRLKFLTDVIDAYKKGEAINSTYLSDEFEISVNADFSKYEKGNIIALFAGHHHRDSIEYTKTGVPYIYIANVMMYGNVPVERKDGEKSEILFDMVTINRDEKKIYLTRIGAGEDRETSY